MIYSYKVYNVGQININWNILIIESQNNLYFLDNWSDRSFAYNQQTTTTTTTEYKSINLLNKLRG